MSDVAEKLCLNCGLCCNGVIFADVRLQRGDEASRLAFQQSRARQQAVTTKSAGIVQPAPDALASLKKFPQPCAMHDGCRCAIYHDRPRYCREFECRLLKAAQAGQVTESAALRIIKEARKKAARVRELLEKLGDSNSALALSKRFQAMRKRMESGSAAPSQIEIFALLTVAVHELNLILSERFY